MTDQPGTGARFEWGLAGAVELGRSCAVLVVVDVLSFTTAVDVAVGRGIRVHPYQWGAQAQEYAARIGASVAVGRSKLSPTQPWSLSPASLERAPLVADLVLPSPNGSSICAAAGKNGTPVLAACLRNARAVAGWLTLSGYGTLARPIGVIASGERWPDGTLRPAVEDLLGAAAVLDGLAHVPGGLSVEATVARTALTATPDPVAAIRGSASGRELIGYGFGADVEVAVAIDSSPVVPMIVNEAFVNVGVKR